MFSFWSAVLTFVGGILSFFNKGLEYIKTKESIEQGRKEQAAEIAAKQAEIARKQAEIIAQNQTKEQTEKKLDSGTF